VFLVNSVFIYAARAVARRVTLNSPVYASIAAATALLVVVLTLNSAIEAQGATLLGAAAARDFASATRLLALMGVFVGLLHIQLLIGRLMKDRIGELRLLVSIAATPSVVFFVLMVENLMHASIGWAIGTLGVLLVLVSLTATMNNVMLPTIASLCGISFGALGIAVFSVAIPTIVSIWGVSLESRLMIDRI